MIRTKICTRCAVLLIALFSFLATACADLPVDTGDTGNTGDTSTTDSSTTDPSTTDVSEQDAVESPTAQTDATTGDEFVITELIFEGNGDTFLERIDEVEDALAEPVEHRFVEVTDAVGVLWQGELLMGADVGALLLQAQRNGSAHGVQIELAEDVTLSEELLQRIAAALPTVETSTPAPDVTIEFVRAHQSQPGVWRFDVTLNHPDTGWEDYTDGWHVATVDGTILGTRILLHPHENEMPFTRSLSGVAIPDDVTEVLIRAHDLVSGYEPDTVRVPLGQSGSGERYEVVQ